MKTASELVTSMCETIDRCGVNIPLTTWLLSRSVCVDVDRALELLTDIESRGGKIIRHWYRGSTIWIRPRHKEAWDERARAAARCLRKPSMYLSEETS